MERAVVILGAGASYDVWNGTGHARPAWRPPLAKDLFGRHREMPGHEVEPDYDGILLNYRGAKVLAQDLVPASRGSAFNLEERLRQIAESPDRRARRDYLDVPPYLREVLVQTSSTYTAFPGSYTQLLRRLLEEYPHQLAIVTLNYDTLFEQALSDLDPAHSIRSMDDYAAHDRQVQIFKIHGSTDWGIPLGNAGGGASDSMLRAEWAEQVDSLTLDEVRGAAPVWTPTAIPACWRWLISQSRTRRHLYPKLTAPLARKEFDDIVCPPDHVEALRLALSEARKFLVIGCSGLDDDLLRLLAESVRDASVVHFVADKSVQEVAARFHQAVPTFNNALFQYRASGGFRNYVQSTDGLSTFADVEAAIQRKIEPLRGIGAPVRRR